MKRSVGAANFLLTANLLAGGLAAADGFQTCYRIDGAVLEESYRCNNGTTGHSACCNTGEVCWSNGVCQSSDDGVEDWLRRGCTDHSWEDPACFDVCPWIVGVHAVGVRPCGGIEDSNQYCCDDGSTGAGSFSCYKNSSSTFNYNNITTLPTVIATIPIHDVSSTSSANDTSSTSSAIGPASTESSPAQSTTSNAEHEGPSSNGSNSAALGAGLGVGLPVSAAIIGGIWFMIWRSKRKEWDTGKGSEYNPQTDAPVAFLDSQNNIPKSAFAAYPQELSGALSPQEMPLGHGARELPA
ncbi:hypothetical protein M426DRAFT_18438 [Hypoxylon sp. CI-4A]|nr:hypothetical protein M426DRAFT_18438 [Hypoxylon sp. CI-4A]